MSLLSLIILLIVCGVALWAINEFIPMDANVKKLLNILVILVLAIIVIVFLLQILGISTATGPHLRIN